MDMGCKSAKFVLQKNHAGSGTKEKAMVNGAFENFQGFRCHIKEFGPNTFQLIR